MLRENNRLGYSSVRPEIYVTDGNGKAQSTSRDRFAVGVHNINKTSVGRV